ncbi:MAG TPA: Sec-independent protein translocase protein TatB [Gammaproteobacteria bacterium]|nr:Sec-independent protein translocase protein TatB [Gammaproteobacteria bacterium]
MLEGSFWELALIFVLALVVFGPERLPGLARSIGLWVGRARAILRNLGAQIEHELEAEELRKTAAETRAALRPAASVSNTPADKRTVNHGDDAG